MVITFESDFNFPLEGVFTFPDVAGAVQLNPPGTCDTKLPASSTVDSELTATVCHTGD